MGDYGFFKYVSIIDFTEILRVFDTKYHYTIIF